MQTQRPYFFAHLDFWGEWLAPNFELDLAGLHRCPYLSTVGESGLSNEKSDRGKITIEYNTDEDINKGKGWEIL